MSADLESLKEWIGRTETAIDYVTVPAVDRLAATLDRNDPFPKPGDPLPVGWHSILFPRVVRHSQIGPDGHPARGDFLPPVPLPRRMFAGKRTTFIAPLQLGDEVKRLSTIQNVTIKDGRSGRMVFVTVKTDITSPRGLAITEEQDIVYREEAAPGEKPPVPQQAPEGAAFGRGIEPDPVLLFRYSALTFNSHRIHYDRPYNENVEGYAGLVVHGPLLATLMLDSAIEQAALRGKRVAEFSFRAMSPLLDTHPFRIEGLAEGDGLKIWAAGHDGRLATLSSSVLA